MSGSLLYYADILANDADEYHKFVDETMNDINKACDLAVELQECNFSTLVKNTAD
jgi:hypothetical protein